MTTINLKALIKKLNLPCQQSLESAAGACLSASHYNIEIEHWLIKLLEPPQNDMAIIFSHYGIDASGFLEDLSKNLSRLKTGNMQAPALSQRLIDLMREAWMIANLEYGASHIRSVFLLDTLISDTSLSRIFGNFSRQLDEIPLEDLRQKFTEILANSAESVDKTGTPSSAGISLASKTSALDQYTINLTHLAQTGKIDPVIGREEEIRQIIDILMRRRQNNPILTGEPGVGKTAVVEGFALRIAKNEVPPALQSVAVHMLDLGLLQAGAGIKGEFENRLKSVIKEVKNSATPIILFVDEAHTLVGAGAQAGQGDAANMLKPALARGELRTIAATTWAEYKKYFEQDAALARRFQVVKVQEPTEETAVSMLRGLVVHLEQHHGVRILDEAIEAAVHLSNRYITHRQLPDKAISILDTACARLAIRESTQAPMIEDSQRKIIELEVEIGVLEREQISGSAHSKRLDQLLVTLNKENLRLAALNSQWEQEKIIVTDIREARTQLESTFNEKNDTPLSSSAKSTVVTRKKLNSLTQKLKKIQGEQPLLEYCVSAQSVAEVVSAWTGIPLGRMVENEINAVLQLEKTLQARIVGQSHALKAVAQTIHTSRAQLADPRKPVGTFLFVGPSGVGKTETAIALAEILYGGVQNMTVINLSEFKEEHKVSLLLGSPPGYVGYGEGGVLTEAVRRRPYSLVLLDEVEKAHSGIQDIFYQVFDKGMLKDGQGRDINFKNTVLILTSNVGSDLITKLCADPDTMPDLASLKEAIRPELLKVFKPAFLGRVTLVPYFPLSDDVMHRIIGLQLQRIQQRVVAHYQAQFTYDSSVVQYIADRCQEVQTGARNIDHVLTGSLLPELSAHFLTSLAEGKKMHKIHVGIGERGFIYA